MTQSIIRQYLTTTAWTLRHVAILLLAFQTVGTSKLEAQIPTSDGTGTQAQASVVSMAPDLKKVCMANPTAEGSREHVPIIFRDVFRSLGGGNGIKEISWLSTAMVNGTLVTATGAEADSYHTVSRQSEVGHSTTRFLAGGIDNTTSTRMNRGNKQTLDNAQIFPYFILRSALAKHHFIAFMDESSLTPEIVYSSSSETPQKSTSRTVLKLKLNERLLPQEIHVSTINCVRNTADMTVTLEYSEYKPIGDGLAPTSIRRSIDGRNNEVLSLTNLRVY